MIIGYSNSKVEKEFLNFAQMQKHVGSDITRQVKKITNRLKAAPTMAVYLQLGLGKPHRLSGELNNSYGIFLTKNYRLVISPVGGNTSELLENCREIIIKGVLDYHGNKYNWLIP